MNVYDQLLVGIGVSLAVAIVGGLLLGPIGVLPITGALVLLTGALTRFAPIDRPSVRQGEESLTEASRASEPAGD